MSELLTTVKFIPVIAQKPPSKPTTPAPSPAASGDLLSTIFMVSTGALLIAIIGLVVYGKKQIAEKEKELKLETYKTKDLQKRLKLALTTIKKMETNPDLVHSRDFNLDYLRMRMDEEVFHYSIVNQIKMKVKQLITIALRPTTEQSTVGVANTSGRQVDEIFDVNYETDTRDGKRVKGVLFRVQIQLTKLPTQSTSITIQQLIDCIETFLSPDADHDHWQPTIQGRIVSMDWDQKAKPTPLLVFRQSDEGVNVSFRTNPVKPPRTAEK